MGFSETLKKAGSRALGGGVPGAIAMVLQVVLLMWLRTAMNYQYKNGGTIVEVFTVLYAQGGVARFYKGVEVALLSSPIARFGDTAANEGVKELFSKGSSPVVVSLAASIAAALWRITITPMTTMKTMLQTEGTLDPLWKKMAAGGPTVLFEGSLGAAVSTAVGFYPWSLTYEFADRNMPKATTFVGKLCRRAGAGLIASLVSDVASNSIRVVTAYKATSDVPVTYMEAVSIITDKDGYEGLFFRGLGIKLISNAISAMLFSILWKYLMDMWNKPAAEAGTATTAATAAAAKKTKGAAGDASKAAESDYARRACEGVMWVYGVFGVLLLFFPGTFLSVYGVASGKSLESTATINLFWCMLGLHLLTISMIMRAAAICSDTRTMGLMCLIYSVSALAQVCDLFISEDARAVGFEPSMIFFNVAVYVITGIICFHAWKKSGSPQPNVDPSNATSLVYVLRASEFFYAMYGVGCATNGQGMYKTYLKGVEFDDDVKPVVDQALHATGIAMLCIVCYTETVVIGGHVETQYAMVRAFSYTWMMSLGFIATNNILVPLLGWPTEMTILLIAVNLGMTFLNMRVITEYDRAKGIVGDAAKKQA